MSKSFKRAAAAGFTLIELLIVVIILAILAAIAIPQFSATSSDAQQAALDANLSNIRNSLEQYKVQHAGAYPGANASSGGSCTTKGTGGAGSQQAMLDQLKFASNAKGDTCQVGDPTEYKYGPYLRTGLPAEPINNIATVVVTATGAPITAGTTGGWAYDTQSGQFIMNSTVVENGKAYSLR